MAAAKLPPTLIMPSPRKNSDLDLADCPWAITAANTVQYASPKGQIKTLKVEECRASSASHLLVRTSDGRTYRFAKAKLSHRLLSSAVENLHPLMDNQSVLLGKASNIVCMNFIAEPLSLPAMNFIADRSSLFFVWL